MIYSALESQLRGTINAFPAECALFSADLESGEPIVSIRPNTQVVAASTIKVAVLYCALHEVEEGRLSLSQSIPISSENFCEDTHVFEQGYCKSCYSLWEYLYWMIVSSDNTATNTVLSTLGFDLINDYCSSLELNSTVVQRKMLDWKAVEEGRNNFTSPSDQYKLYSMLYHNNILTKELRAIAFDFLSRCRSFSGLQRYIPDPITVLHKPGGLDHLSHDAGIFLLEKHPYFVGIFTWDGPSETGDHRQDQLIGQLSRMIYNVIHERTSYESRC